MFSVCVLEMLSIIIINAIVVELRIGEIVLLLIILLLIFVAYGDTNNKKLIFHSPCDVLTFSFSSLSIGVLGQAASTGVLDDLHTSL